MGRRLGPSNSNTLAATGKLRVSGLLDQIKIMRPDS